MKNWLALLFAIALLFPTACPRHRAPRVDLPGAEEAAMVRCRYIDTVNENVAPNTFSLYWAARDCADRVQARAMGLGATHLVWLYRNRIGASARAFRCP
jgi:hypothetical protein